MSLINVSKECHDAVKKAAERHGLSMGEYTNKLISQIGLAEKGIKVIMTIPNELAEKNEQGLRDWLKIRTESILRTYYKKQ